MKPLAGRTVGILGLGNMGRAIVNGLVRSGLVPSEFVVAYDVRDEAFDGYAGYRATSVADLANRADVLVVAVKPWMVVGLSDAVGDASVDVTISVAAGVPLASLRASWGRVSGAVVRVMPNTPAAVGAGVTGVVADAGTPSSAVATAEAVFGAVGTTVRLARESDMHAFIGLAGSGPAYVFAIAEALADGAVAEGMPRAAARRVAASMLRGAAELLVAHDGSPADLKDAVASPGGTTIEALAAMEHAGVRAGMIAAVRAASRRSRSLEDGA